MKTGIFFDVDGTLRDIETARIPESAGRALDKLKRAGYFLGVATGRAIHEIEDDIRGLVDWDAFVCHNGQTVYTKNDDVILEKTIPVNIVERCLSEAGKSDLPVQIMTADGTTFITAPVNENVVEASEIFGLPVPKPGTYNGEHPTALMIFAPRGYDYTAYRAIDGITLFQGVGPFADIALSGVSKRSGIEAVMERYNLDRYIAFGDSFNDLEMFSGASISVAMGNAFAEAMEAASHRTSPVLEDGIERACESLGLY